MEFVGFCSETQRRIFSVLSAVLHIGNLEFQPKKSTYNHDESVTVKNTAVVATIAQLLRVKEEILHQALISKRARASGETLVINYRMPEVRNIRTSVSIFCFLSNILHPFFFFFSFLLLNFRGDIPGDCGAGRYGQVPLRLTV
jgi:myosin heavy subunit